MTLLEKQRALRSRAVLNQPKWEITNDQIDDLIDEFLPESGGFCRFPVNCPTKGRPLNCANRCNSKYWRDHNRGVADLMEIIARHTHADVNLYRTAGLVHDLDYLRFPHDDGQQRTDRLFEIHPMVGVERLERLGAPPDLLLAIMEHAPHTGCKPSSPISHALIAADNIATFRAAGKEMPLPAIISGDLETELKSVSFEHIDDDSTTQENRGYLGTQSLDALLRYHQVLGMLSDLIHGDRLICLTGTGISLSLTLKDKPDEKIPDWFGLVRKLYNEAISGQPELADAIDLSDLEALLARAKENVSGEEMIQAASILQRLFPNGDFDLRVKNAVTPEPGQTTETHLALADLLPRGIITWNYDDAHETALTKRQLKWGTPLLPWDEQGLSDAIRTSFAKPFLLKAHGSIAATHEHSVVLTSESYRDLFARQPAYRAFFQQVFTNFNMLIVGFSMADPDFDLLLQAIFSQFGSPIQNHVLIRSADQQREMQGQEVLLRRSYGIHTLYISDWSYLPRVLRDAALTPGPRLQATLRGCLDHYNLATRQRAHSALRRLGAAGQEFATQILLGQLQADDLSRPDESELVYSLGCLNITQQTRRFLLEVLRNRSGANRADAENVETIAHILSVIEPALRREDIAKLEEVLYELSQWKDEIIPDRRLEKYAEAVICRLRAKFGLWGEARMRPVRLHVGG